MLVPHHAFSAATLIALGASEIVMHKMGCLGPIDPSVANIFNPPNPLAPGQLASISVEDVSAFFKFVKEEIGLKHDKEVVQALNALTDKIHPLAVGNVQRQNNQSRMMAKKLLLQHMTEDEQAQIETLIDNLKSNLFFHGHPINRVEASQDLGLKIKDPSGDVEDLMWNLYVEYEKDLLLTEPLNLVRETELKAGEQAPGAPPTTAQIVQQMKELA